MYALTHKEKYRPKSHLSVNTEEAKVSNLDSSFSDAASLSKESHDTSSSEEERSLEVGREVMDSGDVLPIRREVSIFEDFANLQPLPIAAL